MLVIIIFFEQYRIYIIGNLREHEERELNNRNVAEVSFAELPERCFLHRKVVSFITTGWKRDGYKQLYVSVEFSKCGSTSFRPLLTIDCLLLLRVV